MVIKFYGPFIEWIGKNAVEFKIDHELTLKEFSRRVVDRFPILKDYVTGAKDLDLVNSVVFVSRKGKLLRAEDIVTDEDELEFMIILEGG
jgi:hypothetical protein